MKMAVFTIGADDVRKQKMVNLAQAWNFAGTYSDIRRLLDDAKKKKFDSVMVLDHFAIDESDKKELANLQIEIIGFNDKKRLERKIL